MTDEMMMAALVLAAVVLVIIILVILLSGNGQDKDEYDYVDYEEKEEHLISSQSKRREKQTPKRERSSAEKQKKPSANRRQWKLVLENLNTWETASITFYNNIGIGRAENGEGFENYLKIADDPRVSKIHCEIVRKKDALYLRDMESRNGTYLNGERIYGPVMIQKDDVIGLGTSKIEVKRVLRERED